MLRDEQRNVTIPESNIIEYLDQHYPGSSQLIPTNFDLARAARLQDRFYDRYVHQPTQKIVTDRIRPTLLQTALDMADCSAAPALFYFGQSDAVRPEGCGGLPHPPEGTSVLSPCVEGGGALLQILP